MCVVDGRQSACLPHGALLEGAWCRVIDQTNDVPAWRVWFMQHGEEGDHGHHAAGRVIEDKHGGEEFMVRLLCALWWWCVGTVARLRCHCRGVPQGASAMHPTAIGLFTTLYSPQLCLYCMGAPPCHTLGTLRGFVLLVFFCNVQGVVHTFFVQPNHTSTISTAMSHGRMRTHIWRTHGPPADFRPEPLTVRLIWL